MKKFENIFSQIYVFLPLHSAFRLLPIFLYGARTSVAVLLALTQLLHNPIFTVTQEGFSSNLSFE